MTSCYPGEAGPQLALMIIFITTHGGPSQQIFSVISGSIYSSSDLKQYYLVLYSSNALCRQSPPPVYHHYVGAL